MTLFLVSTSQHLIVYTSSLHLLFLPAHRQHLIVHTSSSHLLFLLARRQCHASPLVSSMQSSPKEVLQWETSSSPSCLTIFCRLPPYTNNFRLSSSSLGSQLFFRHRLTLVSIIICLQNHLLHPIYVSSLRCRLQSAFILST